MWKFHNYSITQISHEINFEECRSAKSAILADWEGLYFHFYEFLHFSKSETHQIIKFQPLKLKKMSVLQLLDSPKLISRKISTLWLMSFFPCTFQMIISKIGSKNWYLWKMSQTCATKQLHKIGNMTQSLVNGVANQSPREKGF